LPVAPRLFSDLTINVTNFFRDDVTFNLLERNVLPALVNRYKDKLRRIRIWSAGCATGQEPYSIAMLLLELLYRDIIKWDVTIFATDIDTKVLNLAKEGFFTLKEVDGVRSEWLERYFSYENKGFRIKQILRQLVTFAEHNLVKDSPYHDLDMVVCRNVLIYFTNLLQTRVLKNFYKVIKEEGFLLLGRSEALVGETRRLFQLVDSKAKLYKKKDQLEDRKEKETFQKSVYNRTLLYKKRAY